MKGIVVALLIMSLVLIAIGFFLAFSHPSNYGHPNSLNVVYPFIIAMIGLIQLIIVFAIGSTIKRDKQNNVA